MRAADGVQACHRRDGRRLGRGHMDSLPAKCQYPGVHWRRAAAGVHLAGLVHHQRLQRPGFQRIRRSAGPGRMQERRFSARPGRIDVHGDSIFHQSRADGRRAVPGGLEGQRHGAVGVLPTWPLTSTRRPTRVRRASKRRRSGCRPSVPSRELVPLAAEGKFQKTVICTACLSIPGTAAAETPLINALGDHIVLLGASEPPTDTSNPVVAKWVHDQTVYNSSKTPTSKRSAGPTGPTCR